MGKVRLDRQWVHAFAKDMLRANDIPQLFNSIAILLGFGMLSEPLAFAYAGWICGTLLVVGYGLITCYT